MFPLYRIDENGELTTGSASAAENRNLIRRLMTVDLSTAIDDLRKELPCQKSDGTLAQSENSGAPSVLRIPGTDLMV
jgi:hypothetical protein